MWIASQWVLAKNHQICLGTYFDLAVAIFLVILIGNTVSVETQTLFNGDGFVWAPAKGWLAIW